MNRRRFLETLLGVAGARKVALGVPYRFRLRYAPRIGLLPELPIEQQLEIYAEWGFRAFEYNRLPRHSFHEIEAIRKKREELGMAMGVFVVNSGGWRGEAMVDRKFHEGFLKDVRRAVEIHRIIENEAATVTSGLAVDYLSWEQQTQNCIEALKRAAEITEGTRLMLVLEPLNTRVDHPGYFVVRMEHAYRIVSAVNHPQVRILFDIYHQQISEGNLIHNIRRYWDWIGYFQAGDVPGRKEPYTGEINFQSVFKAIYQLGYKGIVGMEHSLSVPGMDGLKKCFEAYRRADSWEA